MGSDLDLLLLSVLPLIHNFCKKCGYNICHPKNPDFLDSFRTIRNYNCFNQTPTMLQLINTIAGLFIKHFQYTQVDM